jgi:hypothetical protein
MARLERVVVTSDASEARRAAQLSRECGEGITLVAGRLPTFCWEELINNFGGNRL